MKIIYSHIILSLGLIACGSHNDYKKTSGNYQVHQDLSAAGSLTLSYEQVYLYRTIAIGDTHTDRCKQIAADYTKSSGVEFIPESLNVSFDAPGKHCARRNFAKQCETTQYIYTFNCSFKTL